jgi:RNA polymerase sigma-70 factor (ECF subfamily)
VITAEHLRKAAQGESRSIEHICLELWEPLYGFIYYRVQNREEAEDITQDTFVRTLTYCQRHNTQPDNIQAFMKMVALNIIRDGWRQKQRQGKLISFEEAKPLETVAADEQKTIAERMQIENALTQLKPDQKAVLDLRILKGYSVAETAKMLGKSAAAVRVTQYRALQALAQMLDEHD